MSLQMFDHFRFVAVYPYGKEMPFERLILGYGEKEIGHHHKTLTYIYGIEPGIHIYAGYLTMKGNQVKVSQGGSATLNIDPSKEENEHLEEVVNHLEGMHSAIESLFSALTTGGIKHVMLAIQ